MIEQATAGVLGSWSSANPEGIPEVPCLLCRVPTDPFRSRSSESVQKRSAARDTDFA